MKNAKGVVEELRQTVRCLKKLLVELFPNDDKIQALTKNEDEESRQTVCCLKTEPSETTPRTKSELQRVFRVVPETMQSYNCYILYAR